MQNPELLIFKARILRVIDVATLSAIRPWALREPMSIREIARRTGLPRNTVKNYPRAGAEEPVTSSGQAQASSTSMKRSSRPGLRSRPPNRANSGAICGRSTHTRYSSGPRNPSSPVRLDGTTKRRPTVTARGTSLHIRRTLDKP
jgi:hypothetical protein